MDIDVTIITSSISTNIRDVFIPLLSRRWIYQYVKSSSRIIFYSPGSSLTSSESMIRTLQKYDSYYTSVGKPRYVLTVKGLGGGFVSVAKLRAFPGSGYPAANRVTPSSSRAACSTPA